MRILQIEENLRSRKGHHFQFASSLDRAAKIKGVDLRIAVHETADQDIKSSLNAHPVFSRSRVDAPTSHMEIYLGQLRFLSHNWMVYRKLLLFFKKQPQFDVLFCPTVSHYHLFAIWLLQRFNLSITSNVVLFFVQQPSKWPDELCGPVPDKIAPLLRFQLWLFASLVKKGRTVIATETIQACEEYRQLTGYDIGLWPHPVEVSESFERNTDDRQIVFGSFGFARHEKGSDILIHILGKCLRDPAFSSCRFVIQWGNDFDLADGTRVSIPHWIREHPCVEVIDEPLSGLDYENRLRSVSALLLPYRRSSYYGRLSRVSVEAVCYGIPTIVSPETDLVEVMNRWGAGIVAESNTVSAFLAGMHAFLNEIPRYESLAKTKSHGARNYYSGSNFLSKMIESFVDVNLNSRNTETSGKTDSVA